MKMQRRAAGGAEVNTALVKRFRKAAVKVMSNDSIMSSRSSIASKIGKSFQGKRDIYKALGYPGLNQLTYSNFYGQYLRGDVAGRIIDAPVEGSWEGKPGVVELGMGDTDETGFEKGFKDLVKRLRLWHTFTRFDKLASIGQYGVLLYGLDDVKKPEDLATPVSGKANLLYVQPFGEGSAEIMTWEDDPGSSRYGYPKTYKLTMQEPGSGSGNAVHTRQITVHADRVLHTAEFLMESNTYGLPVLQRGFNRLMNLELIVGGSAEMFWQGAFPGYAFTADPDTDMTQTAAALEDEIELFVHDMKRYMQLQGLSVEKLSPEVADPTAHVEVQLTIISIAYGIPKRILMGSERGELASNQDSSHWNERLSSRRINYLEPSILRPFIEDMMRFGVLEKPKSDEWEVKWPDLNNPTDKDRAEVSKLLSEAISKYTADPYTEAVLPFKSYMQEILKWDEDTIKRVVEAAEAQDLTIVRGEGQPGDVTEPEDAPPEADLEDNASEPKMKRGK